MSVSVLYPCRYIGKLTEPPTLDSLKLYKVCGKPSIRTDEEFDPHFCEEHSGRRKASKRK